jgi:raffinose/stachyose/melibiose transport system permease protein
MANKRIDTAGPFGKTVAYAVMVLFTLLTIVPIVWLFYSSFKTHGQIVQAPLPPTLEPTFSNYIEAWTVGNLGTYLFNSVIYTGVATTATVFLGLSVGYGFAKFRYRISTLLIGFFMIGLLITVHSVIVPLFIIETRIGLANTRLGVIIPYIAFGLPLAVYLAMAYIRSMPDSIMESARIDGAGYLAIFRRIIVPMSAPVMTTITILTFINHWNEFVFVFVLTSGERLRSLPVGINAFAGTLVNNFGLQFAALVIGVVPMILFYLFFHRQMKQGFAEGAVKV